MSCVLYNLNPKQVHVYYYTVGTHLLIILPTDDIVDGVRDGLLLEVHDLRLSLELHHDLLQLRQVQPLVHVA